MFRVVDFISLRHCRVVVVVILRNNIKKNVILDQKKMLPQIVANLPGNYNSIDVCGISGICIDRLPLVSV